MANAKQLHPKSHGKGKGVKPGMGGELLDPNVLQVKEVSLSILDM